MSSFVSGAWVCITRRASSSAIASPKYAVWCTPGTTPHRARMVSPSALCGAKPHPARRITGSL
eukprot:11342255-Prorocentrum_lima.AAC.1